MCLHVDLRTELFFQSKWVEAQQILNSSAATGISIFIGQFPEFIVHVSVEAISQKHWPKAVESVHFSGVVAQSWSLFQAIASPFSAKIIANKFAFEKDFDYFKVT